MTEQEIEALAEQEVAEALAEQDRARRTLLEALADVDENDDEELLDLSEVKLEGGAEITFVLNIAGADNLGEAVNRAALIMARYGTDALYMLATDTGNGNQWIVQNGTILDAEAIRAANAEMVEDLDAEFQES